MAFAMGIDLGTTFTAAALVRPPEDHDRPGGAPDPTPVSRAMVHMATLGHRSTAIPSVVYAADHGLLVGDRAVAAGMIEPSRRASEFKRRLGDTTPLLLGDRPYSAQALLAALLSSVLQQVGVDEGGPPQQVVLTHPANWGPFKRSLLDDVVRLAALDPERVAFVTEPEAAASFYAGQTRVPHGATVAVYDLGGGTFDTTVLHRSGHRFEVVGRPLGIEHLGGIDLDHAVLRWLIGAIGIDPAAPKPADADIRIARQRQAAVEAKEALSTERSVVVPNLLTEAPAGVELQRTTLERLVAPLVEQTVGVLRQAVDAAGGADRIDTVLLVGGASRMPCIAERLSEALERPVAVDAHPKNAVALGAAMLAAEHLADRRQAQLAGLSATPHLPRPGGVDAEATTGAERTTVDPVGAGARGEGAVDGRAAALDGDDIDTRWATIGTGGATGRRHRGAPVAVGARSLGDAGGAGGTGPAGSGVGPGVGPASRRARRPPVTVVAVVAVVVVAGLIVWRLAFTGDDGPLRNADGSIEIDAPSGWRIYQDEPWVMTKLAGGPLRLGPAQVLIMPGGPDDQPGGVIEDKRPSLLVAIAGPEWTPARTSELIATYQEDTWNRVETELKPLCPGAGRVFGVADARALDTRDLNDCDGRVAGGFLVQVRAVDNRLVLLLARYNRTGGLTTDEAAALFERVSVHPDRTSA